MKRATFHRAFEEKVETKDTQACRQRGKTEVLARPLRRTSNREKYHVTRMRYDAAWCWQIAELPGCATIIGTESPYLTRTRPGCLFTVVCTRVSIRVRANSCHSSGQGVLQRYIPCRCSVFSLGTPFFATRAKGGYAPCVHRPPLFSEDRIPIAVASSLWPRTNDRSFDRYLTRYSRSSILIRSSFLFRFYNCPTHLLEYDALNLSSSY